MKNGFMEVNTQKLIECLEGIREKYELTDTEDFALLVVIAHLYDEEEEIK